MNWAENLHWTYQRGAHTVEGMIFIPGNTMTENVRELAWSALPDAPIQPDDPPSFVARLRDKLSQALLPRVRRLRSPTAVPGLSRPARAATPATSPRVAQSSLPSSRST